MPAPPAVQISLSDDERSTLQAWTSRRKTAHALALRARIVLAGAGNVFSSSAIGILAYSSAGALLGVIPVPETVSNCVFGGPDGRGLFIAGSTSLYGVEVLTTAAGVAAQRR